VLAEKVLRAFRWLPHAAGFVFSGAGAWLLLPMVL